MDFSSTVAIIIALSLPIFVAFIWTINGDNQYNPLASKNNIVLADKIMSLFDFTEPYYQNIAHNYLLLLLDVLLTNNISITWMGYTLLDTNYVDKWTNYLKERNYNYGQY